MKISLLILLFCLVFFASCVQKNEVSTAKKKPATNTQHVTTPPVEENKDLWDQAVKILAGLWKAEEGNNSFSFTAEPRNVIQTIELEIGEHIDEVSGETVKENCTYTLSGLPVVLLCDKPEFQKTGICDLGEIHSRYILGFKAELELIADSAEGDLCESAIATVQSQLEKQNNIQILPFSLMDENTLVLSGSDVYLYQQN